MFKNTQSHNSEGSSQGPEKDRLRQIFRQARKNFVQEMYLGSKIKKSEEKGPFLNPLPGSTEIAQNIRAVLPSSAKVGASYLAAGSEANPRLISEKIPQCECSYPKVVGDSLSFYKPSKEAFFSLGSEEAGEPANSHAGDAVRRQNAEGFVDAHSHWTLSEFGIWEPLEETSEQVSLGTCDFVLVPGLAFDRKGGRLGSGKGFYDRALEGYNGVKVGVAHSVQVTEDILPCGDHDVLMDYIVTEKFIVKVVS